MRYSTLLPTPPCCVRPRTRRMARRTAVSEMDEPNSTETTASDGAADEECDSYERRYAEIMSPR